MGASLYEINNSISELLEQAFNTVDENGEVQIDFSQLEALQEEKATKIENIALYIKNLDAEAAAIKGEEENLASRRKRKEKRAESLRNYLLNNLDEPVFESARCSLKIKETDQTEILDESLIPDEFMNIKMDRKPDKNAIKKAIKEGKEVAGATVIKKKNVRIE